MVDVVLMVAVSSLISILLILLALLKPKWSDGKRTTTTTQDDVNEENSAREAEAQPQRERIAQGPRSAANRDGEMARHIRARRARGRVTRQMQTQTQTQTRTDEQDDRMDEDVDEDELEEDPLAQHIALPEGKIGAKKRRKLEMKAEKRVQREREEEEREERKQRQFMLEEQRKKEEEQLKKEEAKQEEEEKLRKEERERKEHEEYLMLKQSFNVEGEGFEETVAEKESQDLLKEFVDFIKTSKVVLMEDLAVHFKLKVREIIDRIQTLQKSGQLTGVVDDRGKFIYVSQDELQAVAKFIQQRGRVSIAELVESSNTLINLTTCSN